MEKSKHVQCIPPARDINRLVTVACLGLLAFNAFHLFGGCQSFLRYKAFLERNPREVEQLVSTIYSLHPSLVRANQFDRKQLEFFLLVSTRRFLIALREHWLCVKKFMALTRPRFANL